jgi:hypothetical protein
MAYVNNEVFLGRHRLVYAVAGGLLITSIVFKARLVDTMLLFFLAGQVPGTSIVLSPDTMLWAVGVAIWALLGLIVVRSFIKRSHRNRHKWRTVIPVRTVEKTQISVVATDVEVPVAVRAIEPPIVDIPVQQPVALSVDPIRYIPPHKRLQLKFALVSLGLVLKDLASVAALIIKRTGQLLVAALRVIAIALAVVARKSAALTVKLAVYTWHFVAQKSSEFWQWLEPRLWNFDEWLELRVRSLEAWTARKVRTSPRLSSLAVVLREYRKTLRAVSFRLAFKPVPGEAKPDAPRIK